MLIQNHSPPKSSPSGKRLLNGVCRYASAVHTFQCKAAASWHVTACLCKYHPIGQCLIALWGSCTRERVLSPAGELLS